MKRMTFLAAGISGFVLLMGANGALAAALACDFTTGVAGAGECQITTTHAVTGPVEVDRTLHIFGNGRIDASGGGITLSICVAPAPAVSTCDLILDTPAPVVVPPAIGGGQIEANDILGNDNASNITINVSRDVLMHANSAILAENKVSGGSGGQIVITAGRNMSMNALSMVSVSGSGSSGNSPAGAITITVGDVVGHTNGIFSMDPTSKVLANSSGASAGAIAISAGLQMDVDGLVQSASTLSGTGANQKPGGGPITLVSGCKLVISDAGKVSSEGRDPGADLVHLEGCDVVIYGLVQSTAPGAGHVLPNNPANHCNLDPTAHPVGGASGFDACVEIWGNTVTIDNTGSHNGEVNADGIRSPMRAWIDIFARRDITIIADTVGKYAVHANACDGVNAPNAPCSNANGGLINVKSQGGNVVATALVAGTKGLAIQATAVALGGHGGDIIVQAGGPLAGGSVDFTADAVQDAGNAASGTGGSITAQSFNASILGAAPGELNAGAAGAVNLTACVGDPNVTYAGNVIGTETDAGPGVGCAGTPTFPTVAHWLTGQTVTVFFSSHAQLCDVGCIGLCSKSGRKFNDLLGTGINDPGYPGISGVTIHMFDQGTLGAAFHDHQVTGAGGVYAFTSVPPGVYFVCEQGGPGSPSGTPPPVNPLGTGQTFPLLDQTSGACQTHTGVTGSRGYAFTLAFNANNVCAETGNDFGNHAQKPRCPEDPNAILTRTVDPLKPLGGQPPNYTSINDAYLAAADGEVIGIFGKFVENVLINKGKSLTITQCTSAKVTAADSTLPVWTVSGGPTKIIGPDAVGGTIGWLVSSDSNKLKAVRANNSSQYGILITGNNNELSVNAVSGNPVGIRFEGNGNKLGSGGAVDANSGNGIEIGSTATGNTIGIGNVRSNGGNGVQVDGDGNTVNNIGRVDSNALNGIVVNGNGNTIKNNAAASDKGKGNGQDGFNVTGNNNVLDSNKANANGGDGFDLSGVGNSLKNNQSNQDNGGGSCATTKENCGAEYRGGVGTVNAGNNKADKIAVPSAAKCLLTFPVGVCE